MLKIGQVNLLLMSLQTKSARRSFYFIIVSDIERLDLYEEEEVTKWDLIYIKQKEVTSPFAYAIALPIDDARILIVGGR